MRNCKLCGFSKHCNSLPGICIILQFGAILLLLGVLGYLFVTQEILGPQGTRASGLPEPWEPFGSAVEARGPEQRIPGG